jgi:hypothetical protein
MKYGTSGVVFIYCHCERSEAIRFPSANMHAAAFLVLLLIALNAPMVRADSGPPWASGLDSLA